jgi:hypothetical protein
MFQAWVGLKFLLSALLNREEKKNFCTIHISYHTALIFSIQVDNGWDECTPDIHGCPPLSLAKTCIVNPFRWMLPTKLWASKVKLPSEQAKRHLSWFNLIYHMANLTCCISPCPLYLFVHRLTNVALLVWYACLLYFIDSCDARYPSK